MFTLHWWSLNLMLRFCPSQVWCTPSFSTAVPHRRTTPPCRTFSTSSSSPRARGRDSTAQRSFPLRTTACPALPPPSYRSRASTIRTGIQITFPPMQGDNSHPPTYRSHSSTVGQQAHSRPSLPRDGFTTQQIGSSANNTRVHSRNNSAGNFRVHSRNASGVGAINTNNLTSHSRNNSAGPAVVSTQNDGGNGSTVTVVTPESGPNIVVTNIVTGSTSQDDLLVQQTLQSLEDATLLRRARQSGTWYSGRRRISNGNTALM